MKRYKRPVGLRDDYSGVYVQKNGKVFVVSKTVNHYGTNTTRYLLTPQNFTSSPKTIDDYTLEMYIRRDIIRSWDPLEPTRKVNKHRPFKIKVKPKLYF
jgi:hypothetical protein